MWSYKREIIKQGRRSAKVERKNGCVEGGKRKVEAWTEKIVQSARQPWTISIVHIEYKLI